MKERRMREKNISNFIINSSTGNVNDITISYVRDQ
jgi:hypothetical protein